MGDHLNRFCGKLFEDKQMYCMMAYTRDQNHNPVSLVSVFTGNSRGEHYLWPHVSEGTVIYGILFTACFRRSDCEIIILSCEELKWIELL